MRKKLLFITSFALFTSGAIISYNDRHEVHFSSLSRLIPSKASEADLGNIVAGSHHDVSFAVKNIGESTISIFSVETSCGCTSLGRSVPIDVAPGEEIDLTFRWEVGQDVGPKKQSILMKYREAEENRIGFFQIRGIVLAQNSHL